MPTPHKDAPTEDELYAPDRVAQRRRVRGHPLRQGATAIARITINRPEVRNAFRPQTLAELRDAFTRARDDTEVGAIIFTGAGTEAFCSGGDQRIRGDDGYIGDDDVAEQGVGRLDVGDLHVQIRRLPKPVVAMVAGYAVGGGHILHLVCDLTIAADNAELRADRAPASAASTAASAPGCSRARSAPSAPRRSGSWRGSTTPARRSQMGLVNAVVPIGELERETVRWCREMLALSPLALRLLKASFNAAEDGLTGLQQLSHDATLLFYMTEEGQEGRNAYVEGRAPRLLEVPERP